MPQFAELLSSPDCHCTTYMFQSVMVFDRTPEELHEYLKVPIPMPHVDRDAVGERRLMFRTEMQATWAPHLVGEAPRRPTASKL